MDGYYSDNEINDDKSPIEEEDGILNNDNVIHFTKILNFLLQIKIGVFSFQILDNAEDIILEEESPKDSSEMSLEKNETFIIFDQALHSKNF